jgi:transcriptional regulator of acetoin/glycerol metabolism
MARNHVSITRIPSFQSQVDHGQGPITSDRWREALMLERAYSEFLEMPALRLTCRQAERLWGLDEQECLHLLEFLVDASFLCQSGGGIYARRVDGSGARPRWRIAKAGLDEGMPHQGQQNPSIASVEGDIRLAARVRVPVLVTAKDSEQRSMCARLIHANGEWVRGPFVTLSQNDMDSPGRNLDPFARAHRIGNALMLRHQFDQARGGTLFLDDVLTLPADTQAHLLSLLNERMAPLCSTVAFDRSRVRIVAGASRHLDAERATGAFCELLFYRLNIIHVDLMHRRSTSEPSRKAGV